MKSSINNTLGYVHETQILINLHHCGQPEPASLLPTSSDTSAANGNGPRVENEVAGLMQNALHAAVRRVRSWPVPPNWHASDWFEEVEQVCTCAMCEAMRDYDPARGCVSLDSFVYHRALARALTHYRREWSFSRRCPRLTAEDADEPNGYSETEIGNRSMDESHTTPDQGSPNHEVREFIELLPEKNRDVILEIFWYGSTECELAQELGLSQRAISKRKQVALKFLRDWMDPRAL